MNPKALFDKDLDQIFDLEVFGAYHNIEGYKIICIVDDDELKDRLGTEEMKIIESSVLLFLRQKIFQYSLNRQKMFFFWMESIL